MVYSRLPFYQGPPLKMMSSTVLSQASRHPHASAHPSNFDSFEVLRVTAHHAKFLRGESKVAHIHSCDHSDALQAPQHPASKFRTCTLIHSLIRSILSLQHRVHVLQVTNAVEAWPRDYWSVHFLARYNVFHRQGGLDELKHG